MIPKFPSLLLCTLISATLFAAPSVSAAAGSADIAQEYDQVRRIALRDARVKDAFDRANQRLEEKIVELDPALRAYAAHRTQNPPPPSAPAERPSAVLHHTAPKPAASHATASTSGRTHVVAAGETIASIAARYHVSAASLEEANKVSDPRKLQVGQILVIPAGGQAAPAAASKTHAHTSATPANNAPSDPQPDGMWDKLKRSF